MYTPSDPRRFYLLRREDPTEVSGTGRVADGIQWADGTCTMRWRTHINSTSIYDSVSDVEAIHGHQGATTIVFIDWEPSCGSTSAASRSRATASSSPSRESNAWP